MNTLQKGVHSTRVGFDKLPTPVKIILYGGIASIVALATQDLERFDGAWTGYVAIALGIAANIVAWLILSLKEDK